MKGAVSIFLILFLAISSHGQELVPTNLYQIRPDRTIRNFLLLDSIKQAKAKENYQLILSHNKWYAVGDGDGQVFTPENNRWKRIDQTRLEGYHYGAFLFDCNGALMKYGGYGFWRSHGMFVRFNEYTGDWQIQPSDRDLPFSGELAYFNKKSNFLYTFGNHYYNQSTSEEKTFLDSLFRIDLLKIKWENLGRLNKNLIEKYHLHHRLSTLSSEFGCLVLPISSDSTALFFNFESNKFSAFDSKTNPKLFRFFRELPEENRLFSDGYGIKILSTVSLITIDSLSWGDALINPTETGDLVKTTSLSPFKNYVFLLIVFIVLLGIGLLLLFHQKKKNLPEKPLEEENTFLKTHTLDLSILNTIIYAGAMYPIDTLDYLVIRKLSEQDASTLDLNEWLGLENKQPENQKKQRAEWIKRMNSFFNSIGFNEEAFNRERQETDKRMFVYKMNTKLKAKE